MFSTLNGEHHGGMGGDRADTLLPTGTGVSAFVVPNDHEVLDAVISSKGNLKLAAERLGYSFDDIRNGLAEAEITRTLTPHLHDLKEYMQTAAILELFSFMPQLHKTLVDNLSSIEPSDAVNAYMKLMDQIGKITDDKTLTLNIHDAAWRQIAASFPQDVVEEYMTELVEAS